MEGGLSQHEEWLRRIEQDARTTGEVSTPSPTAAALTNLSPDAEPDELRRLLGELTIERDRTAKSLAEAHTQLGQYQQELLSFRKQVTELQNRLLERDRQLAAMKDAANKHRQTATSLQSEAERQIKQRQEQLESLQARLIAVDQQRTTREQELQAALDRAAAKIEKLSTNIKKPPTDTGWSRFSRFAVVASCVAAFVSAGLTVVLYSRANAGVSHTISGIISIPTADAGQLDQVVAQATEIDKGLRASADPKRGIVELRLETTRDQEGITAVNRAAQALLDRLPTVLQPATAPASQPEGQALTARVAEFQQKLASSSQPALGDLATAKELPDRWNAMMTERTRVLESVKQLGGRVEPKAITTDAANVTAEQIAKAETANPQLQSEVEALKTREDQLTHRLRVSIEAASVQLQALRDALTTADAYMQKLTQESHPEEVGAQLKIVRDSLKTWDNSVSELSTQWQTQQTALKAGGTIDALAIQAALEKSSRQFVSTVTAASTAHAKALEVIGQGQDQTTKRLVLRNTLVKELAPVSTAQEAVLTAARSVILTDNVELTAIVQRFDALRRQVEQRRVQIAGALRQDQLNRLQHDQATQVAQARREQTELTTRVAQIDAELLKLGEQASQQAANACRQADLLAGRLGLTQTQVDSLQQLRAMHEQFARQVQSLPPLPAPTYIPARTLVGEPSTLNTVTALLLGLLPAVACTVGLIIAWFVQSSRQSQETIEKYARSLKELSRGAE
jgi:chromosome segregation ATPase